MTNLIDSQTIWSLRPDEIPGQVWRDSRSNDPYVTIEVKIPLKDPDGNLLGKVTFTKIDPLLRVDKGQLVLFRIAKAGQQLYIDELRVVPPGDKKYNDAKEGFASSHAAKLDVLMGKLENKIEELAMKRADEKMASERESIEKVWMEYSTNLERYEADRQSLNLAFSEIENKQANWDKEQQEFNNAQQELELDKLKFEQAGGPELLELVRQSKTSDADDAETPNPLQDESDEAPQALIKSLGEYFQSQNYSVDDPLLLQTLLCLCVGAATGQFIVLTGPPGSGKTSLVAKIAQAIGAGSGVVPVRPAWIDATDLIGFYNPNMNRYQPTHFLEYVLHAKRYSDLNRLYLLVLDEMNLGRIENYAADFLSLLEKAREGGKDAKLQLYSEEINNRFLAEQYCYPNATDADKAETLQRKAVLLKHMENYPSKLSFPEGLILFGTINVDETTHLPSPKFLDRSLTIQVSGTKLPEDLGKSAGNRKRAMEADFSWALSLATAQRCLEAGTKLTPKAQEAWKLLMKWNEQYFKPLGVRLSHRLPQVYRCYMGAASVLNISNHQTVADTFVLSKILPLITFRDGDKSETSPEESKRNVLEQWRDGKDKNDAGIEEMAGFPLVHAALEAMLTRPGMIVRYLE